MLPGVERGGKLVRQQIAERDKVFPNTVGRVGCGHEAGRVWRWESAHGVVKMRHDGRMEQLGGCRYHHGAPTKREWSGADCPGPTSDWYGMIIPHLGAGRQGANTVRWLMFRNPAVMM